MPNLCEDMGFLSLKSLYEGVVKVRRRMRAIWKTHFLHYHNGTDEIGQGRGGPFDWGTNVHMKCYESISLSLKALSEGYRIVTHPIGRMYSHLHSINEKAQS